MKVNPKTVVSPNNKNGKDKFLSPKSSQPFTSRNPTNQKNPTLSQPNEPKDEEWHKLTHSEISTVDLQHQDEKKTPQVEQKPSKKEENVVKKTVIREMKPKTSK